MPLSTKMKALFGVLLVAVIAAIVAISVSAASTGENEAQTQQDMKMVCVFNSGPGGKPGFSGSVTFTQAGPKEPVMLNGTLTGFNKDDVKAFHVHEFGDFSDASNPCMSTGGHFNPKKVDHGDREADVRHVGDLGNLKADDQGEIKIDFKDNVISLFPGENSILGRACVVHEGVDDLGKGENAASKQNGNAGKRIGCGIVGVAKL